MTNTPDPDFSDVRAADPVRLADLPSPRSPKAQDLLRQTMQDATPQVAESTAGLRSRLPVLGAVAAAVLLFAAGFAILSPSNTRPALATVKAAAQEVAVADSGRIVTTFSVSGGDGVESGSAGGTVELLFFEDDLSITLDVNEVPSEFQSDGIDLIAGVETRIVDDVLYLKGGVTEDWIALDLPPILLGQIDSVDPRTVLETIQTLVEADELGTETVDGVDLTRFQSVVDLDDPSLSGTGWLGALETQLDVETDGTITIDMWVDGDDQLRKVDVTGDLSQAQDGDGSAEFSISTVFSDLNAVDRIVAPEGVVATPMLEGLLEGADN